MTAVSEKQSSYRIVPRVLVLILLIVANIVLGTAWHEFVGHGLVGVACGGRLTEVVVVGVQLWPRIALVDPRYIWGWCEVEGVSGGVCSQLWILTGSVSTLLVSLIAIMLLYARRWSGITQLLLIGCAFWWIDLFTYTLPSFGLRRYVVFGRRIAEPYDAAVALGIPGWLFQLLVLATCLTLAVLCCRTLINALRGYTRR